MATIERPPWRYKTKTERDARDEHIRELWEMGWTTQEIGEEVDLTAPRINQIMKNFGAKR